MGVTEVSYVCARCGSSYSGRIEHGGPDGCQESALRRVTGRTQFGEGPICVPCLDAWLRSLSGEHFARCVDAAKYQESRTGKTGRVYSQHLRGKKGDAKGVWVDSQGRFQEVPRSAKTINPRPDGWVSGRG